MKRVLLVGGTGSTIGYALLKRFQENFLIAATYFSDSSKESNSNIENVSYYYLDIRNTKEVKSVVEKVEKELGPVDVLINNAGIFASGLIPLMKASDWNNVVETNLTGYFNTCKYVSQRMMKRKRGNIINIASLKGIVGGMGEAAYSASKAGVMALTKSLAKELAPYNIRVNAVCPGFIVSDLNRKNEKIVEKVKKESLMDISENLSDVVNFLLFLCSNSLKSVTGQVFHIDSRIH